MPKSSRRGSFRGKVGYNATQQKSKAANYGHLILPRGINMFKEEPTGGRDRTALDILPYVVTDARHTDRDEEREVAVEGSLWYRRPYKLHRSIGVANALVICPGSVGKKCAICEYRKKLLDDGANWKDKEVSALKPSNRNLYYVVPKGHKKYEEKVHLWDISQFCFQDQLNDEFGENEEFEAFPGLEDGLTLKIRFSEEKTPDGRNTFAKTSRIDFEERDYAYGEDLVSGLTSLDEVLDVKDYQDVERLFFEAGDDGDEEDADRVPAVRDARSGSSAPVQSMTRPKAAASPSTTARRRPEPERSEPERSEPEEPTQQESTIIRRRPAAAGTPPNKAKNGSDADECPSGYRFGVDVDSKPECDECPVWNGCMDAREASRGAAS